MPFTANRRGIALPELPKSARSVDVCFGEQRVWSIDLNDPPLAIFGRYHWPAPLAPYLVGGTELVLRDSGSGTELARTQARFSQENIETRVLDDDGIPLAINKWGRLGKTLEAGNAGVQERVLRHTEQLIEQLLQMGLRPFVVGGTLLGAVRAGALLPHDDDADIAYLSEHTNPLDVAVEGFEVGRRLEALGHEVVRHSATHMQLYFRDDAGGVDHYVDVFAAFFSDDGHINQPFHVRGPMREDQMLPFSTVTVQGVPLPAPADTEHWLTINYDENWRTPIPGYRIVTPEQTIRRFRNWFGSFHFTRDYWNDHYRDTGVEGDAPWRTGAAWILAQQSELDSDRLIDLGCGAGRLASDLQRRGDRQVIAADYSHYALDAARRHESADLTVVHANLYRSLSLALPREAGIAGRFDLVANHLFDHLGPHALPQAFRLVRMALRSGGDVLTTLYGKPNSALHPSEPTSWALSPEQFIEKAAGFGLRTEITRLRPGRNEKRRAPYGARLTLDPDSTRASLMRETP